MSAAEYKDLIVTFGLSALALVLAVQILLDEIFARRAARMYRGKQDAE